MRTHLGLLTRIVLALSVVAVAIWSVLSAQSLPTSRSYGVPESIKQGWRGPTIDEELVNSADRYRENISQELKKAQSEEDSLRNRKAVMLQINCIVAPLALALLSLASVGKDREGKTKQLEYRSPTGLEEKPRLQQGTSITVLAVLFSAVGSSLTTQVAKLDSDIQNIAITRSEIKLNMSDRLSAFKASQDDDEANEILIELGDVLAASRLLTRSH